jgi:hypothetical protein
LPLLNLFAENKATNVSFTGSTSGKKPARWHLDIESVPGAGVSLVCGRDSILQMQGVLTEFSRRCEQEGALNDVRYFLSKPGALKRIPHLILVWRSTESPSRDLTADDLVGAVLLYKYTLAGVGIGMYTTNDRSGRGTLLAAPELRSNVAEGVSRWLMQRGAIAVLISYRDGKGVAQVKTAGGDKLPATAMPKRKKKEPLWARRAREIPDYLPLAKTLDATLANIGQRTRSNMRYYRRRAEKDLGCTFFPAVQMDHDQFLAFNSECMYAVADRVATWRYESLKALSQPILIGIKDKDGRWLSLLGGRRQDADTEILWQMNRNDLLTYSLSLVMRTYFIEHEISGGMTRMYIEGGTSHPMHFSFVKTRVMDLIFLRRSRFGALIPGLSKRFIKQDNQLAHMLHDESLFPGSARRRELRSNTKPVQAQPDEMECAD